jgi:hypothetical protein
MTFRSISGYPKATAGKISAPLPFAAAIPPATPIPCAQARSVGRNWGLTCGSFVAIAIFASMSALGFAPAWLPVETDENRTPYSGF